MSHWFYNLWNLFAVGHGNSSNLIHLYFAKSDYASIRCYGVVGTDYLCYLRNYYCNIAVGAASAKMDLIYKI